MMNSPTESPIFHEHVFLGARHDENTKRTLLVVFITAAMMVAEIIAGFYYNSMALLADGFHMATHAGALTVAAAAYVFARRYAADRRFSFGTGKVGDLAGFASAIILGLVALGIGLEAVLRFISPQQVAFQQALIVAVIGLAVNVASAAILGGGHQHGDHHHHDHPHGEHHHEDNNLRSAYLHVLADALTSVLAIVALLGGQYLNLVWLDPMMGIVGAVVIAVWSVSLVRRTGAVLLDVSDEQIEAEIREVVEGAGDAVINDLHLWKVGPSGYAAIVSVRGIDRATVAKRLVPVHEVVHLTVEAAA